MGWSPNSATNAYLDTLKLLSQSDSNHGKGHDDSSSKSVEPHSSEFISALAAGMSAKLIVEVSPEASRSTVALAAAARQTGGRLVCILPEHDSLAASKHVIEDSGLDDMVEFKVGDPYELLPEYENIDFSFVDCKTESGTGLLKLLDVNRRKSVVVANNLVGEREGLAGEIRGVNEKCEVRSVKHLIGEGMEVTMIGKSDEFLVRGRTGGSEERQRMIWGGGRRRRRPYSKSKWVSKIDDESGEEHIFRVPRSL